MPPSWAELFDRGAEYDGDLEAVRGELETLREDEDG
ncbi:hypothetical protein C476_06207 [Natrinema limicola JCM 13563]|uniref:Uncharacterized protein n=1 Tax=Natrinema limicola JCM 13563 TaxID=1230457 RepID=M0CI37_9EURY|nr:hypothetical protein C476_06207 [Natrinema limicola JCM 13563]